MDDQERESVLRWFDRNRRHTEKLFASIRPEAYYARPIPLRQPVVFYEGHFAAFNYITLVRRALGRAPFDARLDELFERGIDPETVDEAREADADWPARETVLEYVARADQEVRSALESATLQDDSNPLLRGAEAVYTILEHEAMHHETLRYMLHRLPHDSKIEPDGLAVDLGVSPPLPATVGVPAGVATLGVPREKIRFGWDNEIGRVKIDVDAFEIDVYDVTNQQYLEFVDQDGYKRRELWSDEGWAWLQERSVSHPSFWEWRDGRRQWRGMYAYYPLPPAWPVYVTQAEAGAFAAWKGRRLMTEAEFHRAAYGQSDENERMHAWGSDPIDRGRGNFDFHSPEPVPVGSHPAGRSAWGAHDLVGNGWEWTSSPFGPFPGFSEMPSYPPYSSDFFDGKHFVVKGASQATARALIRRSYRNWFRPTYPYPYTTFRTVM